MSDLDAEKYLRLISWFGFGVDNLLADPPAEQTARLLSQLAALSRHDTPFNAALPEEFLANLRALHAGDPEVEAFFADPTRRALFLSDLLDYLLLLHRCGG